LNLECNILVSKFAFSNGSTCYRYSAVAALETAGADAADVAALTALQPGEGAAVRFNDGDATMTGMAHVQGGGLLLILPAAAYADVRAAAADLGPEMVSLADLAVGAVHVGTQLTHSLKPPSANP
jgi:hypothetical protein